MQIVARPTKRPRKERGMEAGKVSGGPPGSRARWYLCHGPARARGSCQSRGSAGKDAVRVLRAVRVSECLRVRGKERRKVKEQRM